MGASLEEQHLVPQEITKTLMLRRKPLHPMPMHLLTLLLRQQPRMPTVLLMLLLKLLRQQRKLLLLLACLREVERNTCRGDLAPETVQEDPQDAGEGRAEEQVQAGEAREEGGGCWQCNWNWGSTSPSSILWEGPRNVQGLRKRWYGRNGRAQPHQPQGTRPRLRTRPRTRVKQLLPLPLQQLQSTPILGSRWPCRR